jgi:hypothetical protein
MNSALPPGSSRKPGVDSITWAKLINRLDLTHRVFAPPPTKYERAAERQRLRRHDRMISIDHYRTGDEWAKPRR